MTAQAKAETPSRDLVSFRRSERLGALRTLRRALSVLHVCDDFQTTRGLVEMVSSWGHTTRLATDGHTAVEVAKAEPPDVVLLDMEMLLTNGLQVSRQLRLDSSGKHFLIIALTDWTDPQRRRQFIAAGVDVLLIKPVDTLDLETLLLLECRRASALRMAATTNRTQKMSFPLLGEDEPINENNTALVQRPVAWQRIRHTDNLPANYEN